MTLAIKAGPSRGRLYKLFTDLGPYFRKLQSTQESFFFDCLEICVDPEKAPEEREFYGWWLVVTQNETGYHYQRADGLYDLCGNWIEKSVSAEQQKQLDKSFQLFIKRLDTLIEVETNRPLISLQEEIVTTV